MMTADDVRNAAFPKSPWNQRGYEPKAVHDFLALVVRRLEGRGYLSAEDIRSVRFPRAPIGRRGYQQSEIDAFVTGVADAVAALDPA